MRSMHTRARCARCEGRRQDLALVSKSVWKVESRFERDGRRKAISLITTSMAPKSILKKRVAGPVRDDDVVEVPVASTSSVAPQSAVVPDQNDSQDDDDDDDDMMADEEDDFDAGSDDEDDSDAQDEEVMRALAEGQPRPAKSECTHTRWKG